ncbi:hypothetical protein KEJ37_04610 [Candidatus Bathyarchaeota archaeon]|nr:hypothetical protein [Candidatus Bathyarchaeota archaeon]
MLFLNDADIQRLMTMLEAINAVKEAFKELYFGKAVLPERTTLKLKNGTYPKRAHT